MTGKIIQITGDCTLKSGESIEYPINTEWVTDPGDRPVFDVKEPGLIGRLLNRQTQYKVPTPALEANVTEVRSESSLDFELTEEKIVITESGPDDN